MQMSHKNHEFASNDGFLNSCSFSFFIKIFFANKLNTSINDILDSPDINTDVYEIIKRTGGQMFLRSLWSLVFLYLKTNDYFVDIKRKENEI